MIVFAAGHLLQRFMRHSRAGLRPAAAALVLGLTGLMAACGGGGGGGAAATPTPKPTPTAATLSSIAVTPASPAITLGGTTTTVQLTATGTYSDGTTKTLTTTAAWTSSTPGIATVGAATGLVTAVAAGTTTITATDGTVSGKVTFTVNAAPVTLTSIAVTPTSPSIAKGTKQAFTATGTYSDKSTKVITSTVTWASATPTVATISNATGSNGIATAVGVGTSAITASIGSVTSPASGAGAATLTVTPATLVSVAINPTGPTLAVGKTQQFSLIGTYTDGSTIDETSFVTWTSGTPATATISDIAPNIGLATTAALGTTTISASAFDGLTATPVTLTVAAQVYAYATNFNEGTVSEYAISPAGATTPGALTPLTTPTIAAGTKPFSVSVEPTGQYAYVANYGSANVSEYTIGTGGQLTPVGAGTVATGRQPNGVTIDPADKHAYVANLQDSTVSQFSIGNDGVLNPLTPATVSTLPTTTGVTNPSAIAIDPTGKYAYATNFGDDIPAPPAGASTITQFTVNGDGTLTLNSTPTAVSGSGPNAIVFVVISGAEYAYVVNVGDGTVSQYSIGSTGVLTALSPATVTSGTGVATTKPFGLAVNPAGTYLYVANAGENTISQFSISQTTGALTQIGTPVTSGNGVSSVTVDATGKYVYGTNRSTNTISQFAISGTGTLTLLATPVTSGTTSTSSPTSIATGY